MVFKSAQKQERYGGLNIFVSKKALFLTSRSEISIFRQNAIYKRLKCCFRPKNEVGEENGLFFQILAKIWKKGKKGTIYADFSEILKFRIFKRNFLFKRCKRVVSAWTKIFSGGSKVYYLGYIPYEWFLNRPKSKKNMGV